MSNSMIRLQIALGTLVCSIVGCSPTVEKGKPFSFPREKDSVLFGVNSVTESSMTNRYGKPVDGLVLHEASLIRNAAELANSTHQHFVIFENFLLGNGVRGRYWQQQSEKRRDLGLPVMDIRASAVTIVTVSFNRVVVESKSSQAAHVQISVDTNDFARPFTP